MEQSGNASTFLLSVLDCLSSSVFGNKRSELHFLDIEGVYVLLDLAENSESSLKRLSLSAICTILENPRSFQYFVEWSSKKGNKNASQLLVSLYKDEDKRFGVRYENGILQDTERPLNPNDSYVIRKTAEEEGDGIQPDLPQANESQTDTLGQSRAQSAKDTSMAKTGGKAARAL